MKVRIGWIEEVVGDKVKRCLQRHHWVSWMARDGGDEQHRGPAHHLNGFGPSNYQKDVWQAKMTSPLHECLVG